MQFFIVLAGAATEERSELHFTHQRDNTKKITQAQAAFLNLVSKNAEPSLNTEAILNYFSCILDTSFAFVQHY